MAVHPLHPLCYLGPCDCCAGTGARNAAACVVLQGKPARRTVHGCRHESMAVKARLSSVIETLAAQPLPSSNLKARLMASMGPVKADGQPNSSAPGPRGSSASSTMCVAGIMPRIISKVRCTLHTWHRGVNQRRRHPGSRKALCLVVSWWSASGGSTRRTRTAARSV